MNTAIDPAEHQWEAADQYVRSDPGGEYQKVKCEGCGCTGRQRINRAATVQLGRVNIDQRGDVFWKCDTAAAMMKRNVR